MLMTPSYVVYIALIAMYFVLIWFFFPETKYVLEIESRLLEVLTYP